MADYAIGDLQGCFDEFSLLLKQVDFNPSKDHLYLVGDIVARGPDSKACLDYIYQHQDSVSVTLGNHDLHMIACYLNNVAPNPKDKLTTLFNSSKLPDYIAFLQTQPLALYLEQYNCFISHAGLNPDWSCEQAIQHAQFAQQCYGADNAQYFLKNMYQPHPLSWSEQLDDAAKFRYIVNYFTRMRFITPDNLLDFNAKEATANSHSLIPWFSHPKIVNAQHDLIFGHWAALEGQTPYKHLYALDTGCVWGGSMTLIDLQSKQKFSEKSQLLSK